MQDMQCSFQFQKDRSWQDHTPDIAKLLLAELPGLHHGVLDWNVRTAVRAVWVRVSPGTYAKLGVRGLRQDSAGSSSILAEAQIALQVWT